ncbi:hypothetical protein [Caulobacter sp. DWR3-1-2]|uniref:hypothetical protein n=1 Tax=Caulobacter sp. DWR3-1-2 TaxID=2804647 RepID=UPI003CF4362B
MTVSTAALLEDALREIAGPATLPTSITIDYAGLPQVDALGLPSSKAWIERSTRSLIFAQAEVRAADGALVAAASAVFRRVIQT